MLQYQSQINLLAYNPANNFEFQNKCESSYDENSSSFESPCSSPSTSDTSNEREIRSISKMLNKRKYFSQKEDRLLTNAVLKYKQETWNDIALHVPGRTPKQCRDRWVNYLQPSLKFNPWTFNEDDLLVSLVNEYGTHWTKMKFAFPNRSTNMIKNRWYSLLRDHVKEIPCENNFFLNNNQCNYSLNMIQKKRYILVRSVPDMKSKTRRKTKQNKKEEKIEKCDNFLFDLNIEQFYDNDDEMLAFDQIEFE